MRKAPSLPCYQLTLNNHAAAANFADAYAADACGKRSTINDKYYMRVFRIAYRCYRNAYGEPLRTAAAISQRHSAPHIARGNYDQCRFDTVLQIANASDARLHDQSLRAGFTMHTYRERDHVS